MRAIKFGVAGAITGAVFFGSVGGVSAQELFEADPPGLQFEREVRSTYIVRLDNSLPSQAVNSRAREVAARFGGRIKYTYTNAINGFAITMPSVAMARMTRTGGLDIVSVTRDQIVTIDAKPDKPGKPGGGSGEEPAPEGCDQSLPWGVARVTGMTMKTETCAVSDPKSVNSPNYGSSSYSVCVIDTGVDIDHSDLNVSALYFNAITKESRDDLNGHGSHVAGTIGAAANKFGVVGVAPGVEIVSVKVLNRRGSGSYAGVIMGVDWVAGLEAGCEVANMSLGGPVSSELDLAVTCAAATARKDGDGCPVGSEPRGVTFTLAAGNSGEDAIGHSPARVGGGNDNIHTIAAMDINSNWASWSNYGSAVDYIEPGVSISSTWKNGGYKTISGTSMSAPHMAGLVLRDLINLNGLFTVETEGEPISGVGGNYLIAID